MKKYLSLYLNIISLLLAVFVCGEVKAWEPDYNSPKNLWKYLDQIAETDRYQDVVTPDGGSPRGVVHHEQGSSTWTFTSNQDATDAWQVYCHFYSGGIRIYNHSTYRFAMKVKADGDVTSFRWKAENSTGSSTRYVYEDVRPLKANEECLIKVTWHGTHDGSDFEQFRLGLDLQGSKANTTLTVSEIYLEEVDCDFYDSPCNIWKPFDMNNDGSAITEKTAYVGTVSHTKGSSKWEINITGTGKADGDWETWVHVGTTTNYKIESAKEYVLCMTLRADKDIPNLRLKLEDHDDNGKYFTYETINLKAGQDYHLHRRGVYNGTTINKPQLSLGLARAVAGTTLTLSDISISAEGDWDYDDGRNLWKEVDLKSTYYTWRADDNKVAITHEPGSSHWDIDIKQDATSWSSWINILSGIPIKHSSNYCFYAVICSDHDIPNAKLTLESAKDSKSKLLYRDFYVHANIPYVFKWDFARSYSGDSGTHPLDFQDMVLSMDFEGAPAGTKACIHDIYFAEQEDWSHDAAENKWKNTSQAAGTNHTGFSEPQYDSEKKEWKATTTGTTSAKFKAAFRIERDVTVTAGKEYDFFATIMVDKDITGAQLRIKRPGTSEQELKDSLFFISSADDVYPKGLLTLKAYTPYIFKISAKKANFTASRLEFTFAAGNAQAGTNVTIKDIYLAEHEEFALANNVRKFYRVKAIAADGTNLGYLNRYLRPDDVSQRGYFNLYKDASGNTYLSSIDGRMSFYVRGNTFKDPVTGKYFQRDDIDTPLNSPVMQTYNGLGDEKGNATVFPQLVPNTNEMDIPWTEKHFMQGDKEGSAGQVARRNCMFKLYKTSTPNEYEVRFILRDNKVQNNIRPMALDNAQRDMQSEFSGKGTKWEYPYYLTFAQGVPWNGTTNLDKVIYATTDYTKAARLMLEEVTGAPEVVLTHYVGFTYDTEAKEHPKGEIPEDLLYGDDKTDKDYYKRHDDDPRINVGADPIQRTHELVKEVWVVPGQSVELLPFSDFKLQVRNQYHDTYVRWYDYRTGKHPLKGDGTLDTYKLTGNTFFLRSQYGAFGGGELTGNRVNAASMLYQSTAGRTEDVLDIMAVDVSQTYYNSSNVTKEENDKLYMKEPNIAFRVVFIIRNAQLRANENDTYQHNLDYVAQHKEKLIAPEGTPFQYRLPFAEHKDLTSTSYPTGYVYKDGSSYKPIYHYYVETWDMEGGERKHLLGRSRVPDGTVSDLYGSTTKNEIAITSKAGENGENRVLYIQNPKAGNYLIMVFALDNNGNVITIPGSDGKWLQLMEFELTVLPKDKGNMILRSELLSNNDYAHQRPEEMEKLYGKPTTVVDFDDVKEGATTSTTNGYYMWPRKWEESSYAFGYDNRHDYNMYVVANHSNSTPYSEAIASYTKEYYDVLGTETNGAQQGYFYYTNAAGDPGRMTILNIGKDFCPRSTVYVSAWVKEFSATSETANVVFSFKGIDTDGYETTLSSFATGYVTGGTNTLPDGTNTDNRGLWHHVYYSFHPDNMELVGKEFDHFIISVENNCVNSAGADYAIDDIRAYIVKPAMQARQSVPLCNGEKQTKLILTTDFDNIMEAFPGTSGQIDYCFLDKEIYDEKMKTASTTADYVAAFDAALIRNTYGSTTTYGVLNFKTTFDSNPKYDSSTNYDGVELNQATRYQVGSVRQLVFPSYANDQKMLVGKDYIVAMVDHHAGTDPGALNFDVNNVCSATSEFTVITSGQVKIDGELASAQNGASVCANRIPKITIDMTGIGNLGEIQTTTASYFDWYYGKKMSTEYYKASPVLVEKKGTSDAEIPCKPRFTWMTDSEGNVVITISEGEGTPGETYFRGGGMNGMFTLKDKDGNGLDFSSYFNRAKADDYTYKLTLKDAAVKPADGSVISYSGMIECRSSIHTNDWSDYAFAGYTYSIGEVECYDYAKYNGVRLDDAIFYFRHVYPKATEEDFKDNTKCPLKTVYLQEHRDCIMHFLNKKQLSLYKDSEFLSTYDKYQESRDPDTRKDFFITAIPINPTPDNTVLKYCLEPFQVTLTLSTRAPKMKNGDDSGRIPYPIDMRDVPLRIGLKQLQKVRMAGLSDEHPAHFLYMPLRDVEPATTGVKSLIQKSDDDMVYLVASTDPNVKKGTSGAIPVELDPITNQPVTGAYQIIGKVSNIKAELGTGHGNVCHLNFIEAFKFREGYQYTIKFKFEENYDVDTPGSHNDVCPGDVVCTIKVVPEYQIWTGAENSNWNNDKNWRRVSSSDLLGTAAATADLTTDGGTNDTPDSYVPADFTKVIIPAGVQNIPKLYNLRRGTPSASASDASTNLTVVHFAGEEGNCNYIRNLEDQMTSSIEKATDLINFDMSSVDLTQGGDNGNVACRSWYDHTCQYIHFNSEAQMLSQQYLHYEKAWADFEMEPNKWTTISSPLINVVAGDLYLPTATARQDTPLFEDITFNTALHDRFHPAVFQRSWNARDAKVVHLNGDNTNSAIELNWSQVFNDGTVNYSAGVGFSIKPDVSMMPAASRPAKVKFRLPKADKKYDYWNPDHQNGNVKDETVSGDMLTGGERTHRLADFTSTTFQQVVGQDGATRTKYFLVGNPMMCHLDMNAFFNENTQLERKYWIVNGKGQQYAELDEKTAGYVGIVNNTFVEPFQSFFVAMKDDFAYDKFTPTFNSHMMVVAERNPTANIPVYYNENGVVSYDNQNDNGNEGTGGNGDNEGTGGNGDNGQTGGGYNNDGSPIAGSNGVKRYVMAISASDEAGNTTTALLTDGKERKVSGVEALFDKNLYDRPMVYTNVKGEAMSLSQIMPGDTIPVALSGVRGDVKISLHGSGTFSTALYVLDSQNGECTPLDKDITLQQTENGVRYYILADPTSVEEEVHGMPQVIVNGNVLTVKASAGSELEYIRVYRADGVTMAAKNNAGEEFSITLQTNVYLIDAVCDGKKYLFKIAIR